MWGHCNASARHVWFNLELTKRPLQCIAYIDPHELAHLVERRHDDRFMALMAACLPHWRQHRAVLNGSLWRLGSAATYEAHAPTMPRAVLRRHARVGKQNAPTGGALA